MKHIESAGERLGVGVKEEYRIMQFVFFEIVYTSPPPVRRIAIDDESGPAENVCFNAKLRASEHSRRRYQSLHEVTHQQYRDIPVLSAWLNARTRLKNKHQERKASEF
jgi:hypothetical protein